MERNRPLLALDEGQIAAVAQQCWDCRLDAQAVRAVRARTGGAPWLVAALVHELRRLPAHKRSEAVHQLLPAAVVRRVRELMRDLGETAATVAEMVAVCDPGPLDVVAELAGQPQRAVAVDIDRLVEAGLLEARLPATFVHPLMRDGVASLIPPGRRALLHAEAVTLARARGADREQLASLLLEAPAAADPGTVETLLAAADGAAERGEHVRARGLLRRALAEPPDGERIAGVTLALARSEIATRRAEAAEQRLSELASSLGDGALLAEAVCLRADALHELGRTLAAGRALVESADRLAVEEPRLALRLENALLRFAPIEPELYALAQERFEAGAIASRVPETEAAGYRLAVAQIRAMAGHASADDAVDLTLGVMGQPRHVNRRRTTVEIARSLWLLLRADRFDEARGYLDHARPGDAPGRAILLAMLGALELRAGTLQFAVEVLDAAVARASRDGDDFALGAALGFRCHAHLEREELDAAERDLGAAAPLLEGPMTLWMAILHLGRARLRYVHGDHEGAVEDFLLIGEHKRRMGAPNPAGFHWASGACKPLMRLGEAAEAGRLAAEEVSLARAWGAPVGLAIALRGLAATLPLGQREAPLREALDLSARTRAHLEIAHTAIALGDALADGGEARASRAPYRVALDRAARAGADALGKRVRARLLRVDARPRRIHLTGVEALTPAERRVAEVAATGASNPEIADLLHLSRRTVENHLSRVYMKLGMGRTQLGDALEAPRR